MNLTQEQRKRASKIFAILFLDWCDSFDDISTVPEDKIAFEWQHCINLATRIVLADMPQAV